MSTTTTLIIPADGEMTPEQVAAELAMLSDRDNQLAFLVKARDAIAQAQTVPEVKELLGQAEAMKVYFAHKQVSFEIRSIAAEMSERAQRRMGEMLSAMPKNTGAKGVGKSVVNHHDRTPTLSDMKISKSQSSMFQKVAAIPEEKFEAAIEELKVERADITTTEVLRRCTVQHSGSTEPLKARLKKSKPDVPSLVPDEENAPREGVVKAKKATSLLNSISNHDKLRFEGFKQLHGFIEADYPRLKNYNHTEQQRARFPRRSYSSKPVPPGFLRAPVIEKGTPVSVDSLKWMVDVRRLLTNIPNDIMEAAKAGLVRIDETVDLFEVKP